MSDVEAVPEVHPASTSTLAASGNALLSDEGATRNPTVRRPRTARAPTPR
ncbi:hypothetical protein ACNANV_17880 [Curtobacterium flaccumfaciens pv. flaccumfaciens]